MGSFLTASEMTYTVSGGALKSTQSNPIFFDHFVYWADQIHCPPGTCPCILEQISKEYRTLLNAQYISTSPSFTNTKKQATLIDTCQFFDRILLKVPVFYSAAA